MTYGVQLFGCSKEFRKNPNLFFTKMKEAGIEQIEPCIMFDDPAEFKRSAMASGNEAAAAFPDILWLPHEVQGFSQEIQKRGMTLQSAHVFCADILKAKELLIKTAKDSTITAYVVNTPARAFENPEKFVGEMSQLSHELERNGIQLWLHNGGADIREEVDGEPLYKYLIENTYKLFAQVDTGWVLFGGKNPYEFIASLGNKLKSLHLKDLNKDFENKQGNDIFAPLGKGCVNHSKILDFAKGDVTVVIDQDVSGGDFILDLEESAAFINTLTNN